MEKSIEKIPTWSLGYLINGDAMGLTDEEIKMIEDWWRTQRVELVCTIAQGEESQTYFSHYPLFGLPAEVEDCVVLYSDNNSNNKQI